MWTRLDDYDGPNEIDFDLCIIGAGAAGITLARELRGAGLRLALVESGGFDFDVDTHHLYYADLHSPITADRPDFPVLVMHRLRYFGGSTNHWMGRCRPLDPWDLEARSWVPQSGWPIPYAELARHYPAALEICGIKGFDYDAVEALGPSHAPADLKASRDLETRIFHYSPPTRFGVAFRKDIVEADDIQLFLHANAIEIVPANSLATIERVRVKSLAGREIAIRARAFALATGGIENARLLLNSDRRAKGGVGNRHGQVGKYFMDHPHLRVGDVIFTDPGLNLNLYRNRRQLVPERFQQRVHGVFALTPDYQRRERTLAAYVQLSVQPENPRTLSATTRSLAAAATALDRALKPESAAVEGRPVVYQLHARCEQAPDPANRVELTHERDRLGLRKVAVHWGFGELDRRTWRRSAEVLGSEFARLFMGRARMTLRPDVWPEGQMGAHHSGTTRMHDDPAQGVVDRDCRVHGVANLYLLGSSVFPTIGIANPTLTIVALTLRVAERLRRELRA